MQRTILQKILVLVIALSLGGFAVAAERSDEDKARDTQRKPAEVLAFLGLKKGDTVLDIWSSGGWYTEVLADAVGPEGTVYTQNSPDVLQFRDGYYDKALTARLENGRLANVVRIDQALSHHPIQADSVDVAITALNFHDVFNRQGEEASIAFLKSVYATLKPGGVLGLIDHVGVADADNNSLHRLEPGKARAAAIAAGFVIDGESDLLAHADDDHSQGVFHPDIRGKTDRFILRLKKPE